MENTNEQKEICKKFNAPWHQLDPHKMVAISKDFNITNLPINGLRHPETESTTGWYIWSGTDFPVGDDAFDVFHAAHLNEKIQIVEKYFGLPPGWRFQADTNGYSDVWEDKSLLEV